MSFVNVNAKEIHCKLVYCGPSLGGKTTNVHCLYQKLNPQEKTELFSLPGDLERTLFFDFLPIDMGEIRGMKTRFHIYTVPGQQEHENTRKLVLNGADGIVFVADSQKERLEENLETLAALKKDLENSEKDMENSPFVFQYNKRDLDSALPISVLRSQLNTWNCPDIEAQAHLGIGVLPCFEILSKLVITVLKGGSIV